MSSAFTVVPMSQHIRLEAGKVYEGEITVANPADATSDFHYAVDVNPYSVIDEFNTADLATQSDRSEIVKWIEIENPTGVIKPNEVAKVKYKINVPITAPGGGQYAALGVRSNEEATATSGASVQNVFELASLIFAEVAGDTKHEGRILENTIPGFVTNGQPVVSALLTNTGNVHETAQVEIKVKNAITQEVIFPKDDQNGEFNELVMPGATRYVTREISDMPMLGVFSVTQNISFLGDVSENTATMVACPIWFMVLMIVTLGAIIGGIAAGIVRHRHKKKAEEALQ